MDTSKAYLPQSPSAPRPHYTTIIGNCKPKNQIIFWHDNCQGTRRKSLYCKGLRRAGRAPLAVKAYGVRGYVEVLTNFEYLRPESQYRTCTFQHRPLPSSRSMLSTMATAPLTTALPV